MVNQERYLVKTILKEPSSIRKIEQIVYGTDDFMIIDNESRRQHDLLVYEMGDYPQKDIDFIKSIIGPNGSNEVFLISESKDSEILMQAIRLGVKEFFVQPLNSEEVKQAFERFRERHNPEVNNFEKKKGGKSFVSIVPQGEA